MIFVKIVYFTDFTSQCRSNAAACKGTSKHSQNCQHMNGTYPLEECSNIYMNIDKSSLRFYPELNSTACSAIYQQINDSLCTNVSNWDHCTLDMSKYTQDHPECFKSYTMKTEYECEGKLWLRKKCLKHFESLDKSTVLIRYTQFLLRFEKSRIKMSEPWPKIQNCHISN